MLSFSRRRRLLLGVLWSASLFSAHAALERPAPLFLNLGAGDGPFVRGFREGWERDGLRGGGETMFHWAGDDSRLEFPLEVRGGSPVARLRMARFSPGEAEVTLRTADRLVERWTQPSRGWAIRSAALGNVRGPLTLRFQFDKPPDQGLGIALDWVEITGVEGAAPASSLWPGLLAWAIGVPLVLSLSLGFEAAIVASAGLIAMSAAAILMDRLGGLYGTASAGVPAVLVTLGLTLAWRGLARGWSDLMIGGSRALAIPAAACLFALLAVSHPFFYYPDVDNHARYLSAIRLDPHMVIDSSAYQLRTGSFTQVIGGQRIAFPYSAAFHVTAWPLARFLGEVTAIKTVAVLALGLSLLLIYALAVALGLGRGGGLISQAIMAFLPVTASGFTLARYPTFLGQALDLLLLVYLVRAYPRLGARGTAFSAVIFLTLAQATYTGSLLNVGGLVAFFVAWEMLSGDRARAGRLTVAYAIALVMVLVAIYGRFIPVALRDIVPHLGESQDQTPVATGVWMWASTVGARLEVFYDHLYPLLAVAGALALRGAPRHARRLVMAALLAGCVQMALRPVVPTLLRHAKEMQLLAGPVAVLSAAAGLDLWRRGVLGRTVALALAGVAASWGASAAIAYYAASFFSVGP